MHFSTLLTATSALAVGVAAGRDKNPPKSTAAAEASSSDFFGPMFAHHVKGRATSINIVIDGDASTAAPETVSPVAVDVKPATAKPSSSAAVTKQSTSKAAEPTTTQEPVPEKAKKAGKDQEKKIGKDHALTTTLAEAVPVQAPQPSQPPLPPILIPGPPIIPSGHDNKTHSDSDSDSKSNPELHFKSKSAIGTVTVTMTKTFTLVAGRLGNINAINTPHGSDMFTGHPDATAIRAPSPPTTTTVEYDGHSDGTSSSDEFSGPSSDDESPYADLSKHFHPNVTLTNNKGETITGYMSVYTEFEEGVSLTESEDGTSTEGGGSSIE